MDLAEIEQNIRQERKSCLKALEKVLLSYDLPQARRHDSCPLVRGRALFGVAGERDAVRARDGPRIGHPTRVRIRPRRQGRPAPRGAGDSRARDGRLDPQGEQDGARSSDDFTSQSSLSARSNR